MKKNFVPYLAFIILISCNSSVDEKHFLKAEPAHMDSTVHISGENIYLVKEYIDSLNQIKDFNHLPYFLQDSCLDGNTMYWKDLHHPVSIRKVIIDSTKNIELLRYIVDRNLFKNKCNSVSPNKTIPFYDLSFYDLAKERLNTLPLK